MGSASGVGDDCCFTGAPRVLRQSSKPLVKPRSAAVALAEHAAVSAIARTGSHIDDAARKKMLFVITTDPQASKLYWRHGAGPVALRVCR
jgi:hypothetical protein